GTAPRQRGLCPKCKDEATADEVSAIREAERERMRAWLRQPPSARAPEPEPPTEPWDGEKGLCPRCLEPGRKDNGGYPLVRRWCELCGFQYTLWIGQPRPRTATPAAKPRKPRKPREPGRPAATTSAQASSNAE